MHQYPDHGWGGRDRRYLASAQRPRPGPGLDLRKAIHGINPMYKFMPTVNGYPYQLPYWIGNPMGFDLYRTKDGRLFLPTGAYPGLLQSMCTFLGCSPDKDSIANAVSNWDGLELDEAAADKGLVFALIRTAEEWASHPQGKYLADKPLVEIIKIGDSDPEPFTPAARPLSGLRVLAATHVIAGNVMARTLAEHGAEVLQIAHPEEFEHEGFHETPAPGSPRRRGWTSTSPRPAKRPTNWPPALMCSSKTTAPARSRTWVCRPRNWPRAAPASFTPRTTASATTGRGPTGPGSTWKPSASPGSPPKRAPRTARVPANPRDE